MLGVRTMKLGDKLGEEARRKIEAYLANSMCEVCYTREWRLSDTFFEVREYSPKAAIGGPSLVPMLIVTCSRCSNTKMFNAVMLGLLDRGTGMLPEQKS